MASIIKRANKRKWLQFYFEGKRHTWRIGQVNMETARLCKQYVEQLIASIESGERLSRDCDEWLRKIPTTWKSKLVGFGILEGSSVPDRVGTFTQYILDEHYTNYAPGTYSLMKNSRDKIIGFFGEETKLARITTGQIKLYKVHLEKADLAPATVSFQLVKLRTFLSFALQHKIIDETPFKKIPLPSQANDARKVYVSPETIKALLTYCDPYWQAAICLSRFGGLRAPSDVFNLTWERVNFDKRVIVQYRQKTKREIPFPMSHEVYTTLSFIFDRADELGEHVFPPSMVEYKDTRGSYAQLRRLILRAGLTPWPVLWNSMRTSWGQDLKLAGISQETRARWLDHTAKTDQKHYDLGPGNSEFEAAVKLNSRVL